MEIIPRATTTDCTLNELHDCLSDPDSVSIIASEGAEGPLTRRQDLPKTVLGKHDRVFRSTPKDVGASPEDDMHEGPTELLKRCVWRGQQWLGRESWEVHGGPPQLVIFPQAYLSSNSSIQL